MSGPRPPWFPGQFGRADGEAAVFTGDPYTDTPTEAEPYAPASLPGHVTNPYGEVPAPPPSAPDAGSWLADGGTGGAPGRAGVEAVAGPVAAPPAGPTTGYEDFYEPGSVDRSRLRRPGRRSLSGRRHGPRGESRRKGRRSGAGGAQPPGDGAAAAAAAAGAGAGRGITVVPGGTGGFGVAGGSAGGGASPSSAGLAGRTGSEGSRSQRGRRAAAYGHRGSDGSPSQRRRRTAAWLAALVVVGVGVVVGTQHARDDGPTTADPGPTVPPRPAAPGTPGPTPDPLPSPTAVTPPPGEVAVGTTVSEGPFEVEVLGVSAGLGELAGATAAATAEGEFVVVRLRVTATQPGPSYFLDIDQRLLDPTGGAHEPDARAAMAVDGNRLWFAELDAGESAEGVIVFDVPPGTVPATLEVHASDEGTGARVDLPTP
ncbi:DUF4352 domain-containing protein [Georgenia daeguensis]|uniref:DUF4352 domain-containing protein n=1 Tax=Georgenia daeguensis TaxID=908355 RepID=A0ABP8EP25_9MICO